jgi:hypothetical protein
LTAWIFGGRREIELLKGSWFGTLQMGQINPTVKLYVIALEGGAQTAQLRPPHSFEERYFKTFPGEGVQVG